MRERNAVLFAVFRLITLVVMFAGVVALVGWRINLLDRHFIFFPERDIYQNPRDIGLNFEEVFFETLDGVNLHGWFVPAESDTTLIWFHGNAGNISHRLENLLLLHRSLNINIFIFDYRGYGRSEGSPSEEGMYLDAQAALNHISSRQMEIPTRRLVFFGRSLGSAIAVELATSHQVHAIILESPFTSIQDMARQAYPYLPSRLLVLPFQSRFDSLSKIGRVNSPVMVIHGDIDNIVPYKVGRRLYSAANVPKRFYTVFGGGHSNTYDIGGGAYLEALKSFIDDPMNS